eukprot:TRINITY_DN31665_c0_g1_i1.p1 TRINITY_DN31665_c0_g1~~TRINITY_DN31665_c0_g1_i1.p1  ORF type:complete len:1163 (+),score=281.39 TRINITY_DN31665_c0_g1_i1:105-3593(+)
MGSSVQAAKPGPLDDVTCTLRLGDEPLTGQLLRRAPRLFGGQRWSWHKVVLDGELLCTFSLPAGRQVDSVPLKEIRRVEAKLLVHPKAPVIPLGAIAEAPPGEGSSAGILVVLQSGEEILFCAASEQERNAYLASLSSTALLPAEELPKCPSPETAAPPTEAKKGESKGKGKGKQAPAPPPKSKAPGPSAPKGKAKAAAKAQAAVPKIHGLIEKELAPTDISNTIFGRELASPRQVDLAPFTAQQPRPDSRLPQAAPLGMQEDGTKLFDKDLAQAIGVAVARLDVSAIAAAAAALARAPARFEETRQLDGAEILVDLITSHMDKDLLGQITRFLKRDDERKLRRIEQRLVPLATIPRVIPRLRLLLLSQTLRSRLLFARKQLDLLVTTGVALQRSSVLSDVVGIIQESLEWNLPASRAKDSPSRRKRVFQIGDQLERLKTIKPQGAMRSQVLPGYNFIHWMAEELLYKRKRELGEDPFAMQVPRLHEAALTNPSLAYEELRKIQSGSRLASAELCEHESCYSGEAEVEIRAELAQESARTESAPAVQPEVFHLTDGDALNSKADGTYEAFRIDEGAECSTEVSQSALDPAFALDWKPTSLQSMPSSVQAQLLQFHPPDSFTWKLSKSDAGTEDLVWLLVPHRSRMRARKATWEKCWAKVHARHLVLWQVQELSKEAAVPLPGVEVMPLDSLLASDAGRWLASLGMHGLELRVPDSPDNRAGRGRGTSDPVIICTQTLELAQTWQQRLSCEAQRAGCGWLMTSAAARRKGAAWLWSFVDPEFHSLQCYGDPSDYVAGREPQQLLPLGRAIVRALENLQDAEDVNSPVTRLKKSACCQAAFCIEEPAMQSQTSSPGLSSPSKAARVAAFGVHSYAELRSWLETLQTVCGAGALGKQFWLEDDGESTRPSWASEADGFLPQSTLGKSVEGGDRPTDAQPEGAARTEEDDPFERLAKLRPSFCLALQEAARAAATRQASEASATSPTRLVDLLEEVADEPADGVAKAADDKGDHSAKLSSIEAPQSSEDKAKDKAPSDADSFSSVNSGDETDTNGASSDEDTSKTPLQQLQQISRRLRLHSHRLRKALRDGEQAARTTLGFFGETVGPDGALASLQVFLGQISRFGQEFSLAAKTMREHNERKARRESSMPRRRASSKASLDRIRT